MLNTWLKQSLKVSKLPVEILTKNVHHTLLQPSPPPPQPWRMRVVRQDNVHGVRGKPADAPTHIGLVGTGASTIYLLHHTRNVIELAKAGDMAAIKLVLERILPPRKDAPVSFSLSEEMKQGFIKEIERARNASFWDVVKVAAPFFT